MREIYIQLIEYHCTLNRRVCQSIAEISQENFAREDAYSRGSIRNLMVHIASTDRRWLTGLQNLPDVPHLRFEDYPDHTALFVLLENVSSALTDYVGGLSEMELQEKPAKIPSARWQVLQHLVNHATDHRATVLQLLNGLGAPTFDQDYILWLWSK